MFRKIAFREIALALAGTLAAPALAADLPYGASYAAPPAFTWTGLYLGAQLGYGWGANNVYGSTPYYAFNGVNYTPNGIVGGAHVGYNAQFNQFVIGIEGDVEGTGISKTDAFGPVAFGSEIPVQGSIRARLGFALDRALFYVTGGAAFASVTNSYQTWAGYNSFNHAQAGWTIGGGLEFALTDNWSLRAEYRYADFGSTTDYLPGYWPGSASVTQHPVENAVRVGATYRFNSLFGGAGPVAR